MRLERVVDAGLLATPERKRAADEPDRHHRIRIREANTIRYVDVSDVVWFEAANQYVKVHATSGCYLISTESLTSLQERIDPQTFIRVHRSSIVNVNRAARIRVERQGGYFIEMDNGDLVRVSRGNRDALKDLDI
jgi:two-component system LytT family response regulator